MDLTARFSNPPQQGVQRRQTVDDAETAEKLKHAGLCDFKQMQIQTRLTSEEVAALVAEYQCGLSVARLVERWKVHRTTVMHLLAQHGVDRRPNARKMTDLQVAEASKIYEQGLSTHSVAGQFDVDASTLTRELRAHGTKIRPRRGWDTP